jgi:hypothetical protein
MTELESVNTILATIGEAGISSLSESVNEITDSALAQRTLKEVSRDVQSEAWSWNTDEQVDFSPTAAGTYVVPGNVLVVDFSPNTYPDTQYVLRGKRIYDRNSHTYNIGAINGNAQIRAAQVVSALEWDELPHAAQQYITIRAARIFSDRYVTSSVVFTYTVGDEDQARTMLIRAEENTLTNNLLWGNDRGMGQGIGYIPASGNRYRYY